MGAYHGAQACEIVGLFILHLLKELPNFSALLYRDDGLGITTLTPRQQEKLKQKIINIFKNQELGITIEINLKRVNFLNVTLDLEPKTYQPYRKPGDKPLYVSAWSNHPPQILRNIRKGIEHRLSDTSASEEIFLQAIPPYQEELDRCGYDYQLKFNPKKNRGSKKKKKRSKPVTWFNPPYSMNVATNVGQEFLKLIDKHFPPGNILHSVINRQTVKIGYRCMPSIEAKIAKHNSKILNSERKGGQAKPPSCNCQKSKVGDCPMPGACNTDGVVYQANVKNNVGGQESYIGLAQNFKERFRKHRKNLTNNNFEEKITLYTHFWKEKDEGRDPVVEWKFLEKNIPLFNPVTGICRLCTREKFNILLNPTQASLNSRLEIFSNCKHKEAKLIGRPPG